MDTVDMGESMDNGKDLAARIPGWGTDLPLERRPGVPREHLVEVPEHLKHPARQIASVKIYQTVERPGLTPVFGTSCPPHGLSGRLRDFGYRFGEARLARWLTLMLADRVDVVEGVVSDLRHGKLPRPFKEMGLRSELESGGRLALVGRHKKLFALGLGALAVMAVGLWVKEEGVSAS